MTSPKTMHPPHALNQIEAWTRRAEIETRFDEHSRWGAGEHEQILRASLRGAQLFFELWSNTGSAAKLVLRRDPSGAWRALAASSPVISNSPADTAKQCSELFEEALAESAPFGPSPWATRALGLRP